MIPKAYEVHLEVFEGPLDLLLYLIKKNDLDIENIPISQITKEYLSYLELMKELKLDVVGDFLVMASELMQIKARSLLPSHQTSDEEGPDPRSELVAKLKEYEKFKGAAGFLAQRAEEYQDVFYRGAPRFREREKSLNIRIFDLLSTLREVLDRTGDSGTVVAAEEFPIEHMVTRILNMLETRPSVSLLEIFEGIRNRRAVITCFMALLELVKLQQVFARQDSPFGEVMIHKKEAPPEEVTPVWPDAEPEPGADALVEHGNEAAPEQAPERSFEASPDQCLAPLDELGEGPGETEPDDGKH